MLRTMGFPELLVAAIVVFTLLGIVVIGVLAGLKLSKSDARSTDSPSPARAMRNLQSEARKFCIKCGTEFVNEAAFCGGCGSRRA